MLVDFSIQERICSISTWAHLRGSEASFLWKPAQSRWQEAGIQLGDHSGQGQAQSAFKGPWHLSPSPSPSPKPPWWQVYVKHFDIFLPSASSSLITMININNITSTNNSSPNLSPKTINIYQHWRHHREGEVYLLSGVIIIICGASAKLVRFQKLSYTPNSGYKNFQIGKLE